jgi:sulfite reductase alpha subunit-like flavoprotein
VRNSFLAFFSLGLTDQSLPEHTPQITTLRALFTRYLDFNAVPRRSFFELLRWFATDEMEREKLDEFVSNEGAVGRLRRGMFTD